MRKVLLFGLFLIGCEYPSGPYAPTWMCSRVVNLDTTRIPFTNPTAIDNFCANRANSPLEFHYCRARIRSQGDTALLIQRDPDDCWVSYFPHGHIPGRPDRF